MAAADKKARTSAEQLVDLVALQPVKHAGKRVFPGGELLGVPQSIAEDMLTKGLAEPSGEAKAEAEAKAKADAEAKATSGQAALLPEGNKQ